jgi:hypothetical protein
LEEASEFVVPVSISAAAEIAALREQANGRFISASYSGKFRAERTRETVGSPKRRQFVIGKDE